MVLLILSCLVKLSLAADFYVKSLKAPLLNEAKNGATTVTTIERGTKVVGSGVEGTFLKVEASGSKGFINKLFLSDRPVEGKSLLNQEIDISSKARKRASGFTSAAAARGLKEDSDEIFKTLGDDANAEALTKMESFYVGETEGLEFLSDPGKDLKAEDRSE